MKAIKRTIIFIAVMIFIGSAGSGKPEETELIEQNIQLETVYERTFPDTIVDVIFDTATVSLSEAKAMGWKDEAFSVEEKEKGKVNVSYPCVLITKDKISFLDKEGNVKKEMDKEQGTKILYSSNGKYILKKYYYNGDNDSGGGAKLYDNEGNIIWEKREGAFSAVSDEGYTATGYVSPDGSSYPFKIYNREGEEIKEIKLPDWGIFDAGLCANGDYFIITYRGQAGFDSTGVMIIKENKVVVNFQLQGGNIYSWNIFPNSKGIFLIEGTQISFIDNNAKILWKEKAPLFLEGNPNKGNIIRMVNIENQQYLFLSGIFLKFDLLENKIISFFNVKNDNIRFSIKHFFMVEKNKIRSINIHKVED